MKLATVLYEGQERVGVITGDHISFVNVQGGMLGLIQQGADGPERMLRGLELRNENTAPANMDKVALDAVQLVPPIRNPSKIICIGLNYGDYARAGNITPPVRPLCFSKFPSSLVGMDGEITWSESLATQVDYEAELVAVIGKTARHVSKEHALDYVFGYTCGNDISARDLQNSDGQWVRSKSLDTFAPLGPWVVTADEIADPQALSIRCLVNNVPVQDSSTREMIFGVAALIEFLSQSFTLLPGDLVFTGTPAGVGVFRTPPLYLSNRDRVTVEIERIGRLSNPCRTVAVEPLNE